MNASIQIDNNAAVLDMVGRSPAQPKCDRRITLDRVAAVLKWYGVALALVGVTAWLRWVADPGIGDLARFLPFILVVAICSYGGGVGPGLASLTASSIVATGLFVDDPLSPSPVDLFDVSLFVVEAAGTAFLTATLRRSRDRTQKTLARTQASARQRDQFVTRISHEWRAPLNVLAGWSSQLRTRPDDPKFVARAAANMMQAIETQQRLVEDLLDYSRGSRGRLSIHPVRLAIATPIAASLEATRPAATSKGIALSFTLADPGLRVWGDHQRLQQVFTNLLANSIKFTPKGGQIMVRALRAGDGVEVTVEDNGVGIDAHLLHAVFEPFAQGHPARDGALGGLGLGLSIAREIVLLHAGTIEAWSAGPGHGSTFTVRLPVPAASEAYTGRPAAAASRG